MRRKFFAAFVLLVAAGVSAAELHAETVSLEVQGIAASEPGKGPAKTPAELAKYKEVLAGTIFTNFKSVGNSKLNIAAGGRSSETIGGYTVEVAVTKASAQRAKIEVTLKQAGRAIGTPVSYHLALGKSVMMQVGDKNSPTLIVFTVTDLR